MRSSGRTSLLLLAAAAWCQAAEYREVARIFAANCLGCHTAQATMGGLSLQTHASLMKGGNKGPAIVPGNAAESRLFQMIAGKAEPGMPMGGQKLAAGEIETIRAWIEGGAKGGEADLPTISRVQPRGPVKPRVYSLAAHGDLVATGGFRQVRIDPGGHTLDGHADAVRALAFSRDGKLLAAAGGLPGRKGEVKIWDVAAWRLLRTVEGHNDCIYAVAFSADGAVIATSGYDRLIKLWNTATGQEVRTLKDHTDAVYSLAFTPDGSRLVSGSADRTVKIWDVASGKRLYTLGDATDGINAVALDPSGKLVAGAGLDKSIRIWSLGDLNGELRLSQLAHEDAILRLAWSPDGKYIVSAGADRTVKVFRASDLSEVTTWAGQPDWVYGLSFSAQGKLVAARFDGSMAEYDKW